VFSFGEILKIRVSFVQAQQVVFEYMEVFYNRIRRHAKIGNQIKYLRISLTSFMPPDNNQRHNPDDLPVH
jgi:hypothetical protein